MVYSLHEAAVLQTIDDVIERLVREYDPDRIILFGSRALGTATEDSDIDLLVVKETASRPLDRRVHVERLLRDRSVPLDIHVYTPREILTLFSIEFAQERRGPRVGFCECHDQLQLCISGGEKLHVQFSINDFVPLAVISGKGFEAEEVNRSLALIWFPHGMWLISRDQQSPMGGDCRFTPWKP